MLSKIKLYAGIIGAAIIGALLALFKIEKAKKEAAETKAEAYKDNAVENAKVIEAIKHANKIKSDVNQYSNDDALNELRGYDRSREDKDPV